MMNREEILNMPAGRKMDALIDGALFDCNGGEFSILSVYILPDYSTCIEDAWQIIKAMKVKHFRFVLGGYFMGLNQTWAAFDNEQWADSNPLYKAFADDTPLAICRAALLATLEEK